MEANEVPVDRCLDKDVRLYLLYFLKQFLYFVALFLKLLRFTENVKK